MELVRHGHEGQRQRKERVPGQLLQLGGTAIRSTTAQSQRVAPKEERRIRKEQARVDRAEDSKVLAGHAVHLDIRGATAQ